VEVAASRRALGTVACAALASTLLALVPAAHARLAAAPSLVVTFAPSGAVTVTLPDGTPVGTTSGQPTVIPAGYYSLLMNGPGDCINLPLFELRGPGVNINDDMLGGETDVNTLYADFQPGATYTWHLDRTENIVYTFRTSTTVVGAPPASGSATEPAAGGRATPTSQDITGSAIVPFRGTLAVAVNGSGKLTLAYKGRPVRSLKAGRYSISALDRSTVSGVMLQKPTHAVLSVTGTAFVGKRSASIVLTAGRWLVMPRVGKTALSIAVT
jgi:hypothetical protein